MKIKLKMTLLVLLILLCGSGCGNSKESFDAEAQKTPDAETQGETATVTSTANAVKTFRVEQILTVTIEDPDTEFTNKTVYSGSDGSCLYLLASYQLEDENQPSMWMYTFDINTLKTEKEVFSPEVPGMENLEETYKSLFITEWDDSSNSTRISRHDEQNRIPVYLATVNDFVNAICSDGQDGLYYVGFSELKHLDLESMTEEILCSIGNLGIELNASSYLLSNEEGKLALCSVGSSSSTVYLLTDKEEPPAQTETAAPETIRMVNLDPDAGFFNVSQTAARWSALSSGYRITLEDAEDSQAREALRDRTLIELTSGEGPELMFVSEDDLRVLAEKGVLMDMSELIPEDVQKQLLPGVRRLCTVDGAWIGICDEVSYYTLMTSDSLWSKDSWTVSDMLDLADSKDDWGDWILSYFWFKPDYNILFEIGFQRGLGDSPFMDQENGISYFNGKEFIRTLEFCKRYGQPSNATVDNNEALLSMLQEEKTMAELVYIYDGLPDFSRAIASHKNCHIVGFPCETGSGNYMYTEGYIVVNANAAHIDGIKDFIEYLLDYNVQFKSMSPVRKDVLRDRLSTHPQSHKPAILLNPSDLDSGYSYWPIEDLKPDGTTYQEEFMAFAESCDPVPYCPEAIAEIVSEEIDAFFSGSRSAKDTAEIIHRRVQLYFDENK